MSRLAVDSGQLAEPKSNAEIMFKGHVSRSPTTSHRFSKLARFERFDRTIYLFDVQTRPRT